MSTKRSHLLKQTCSWKLQFCLSVCDHFVKLALKGLMITFWGLLLLDFRRWQSSKFDGSMSTLTFLNNFRTVSSRALFSILLGIPDISRHSLLEYCSFSWHLRSRVFLVKLSLTFSLTYSSDFRTLNFDFISLTSFFSGCKTELNLPW